MNCVVFSYVQLQETRLKKSPVILMMTYESCENLYSVSLKLHILKVDVQLNKKMRCWCVLSSGPHQRDALKEGWCLNYWMSMPHGI